MWKIFILNLDHRLPELWTRNLVSNFGLLFFFNIQFGNLVILMEIQMNIISFAFGLWIFFLCFLRFLRRFQWFCLFIIWGFLLRVLLSFWLLIGGWGRQETGHFCVTHDQVHFFGRRLGFGSLLFVWRIYLLFVCNLSRIWDFGYIHWLFSINLGSDRSLYLGLLKRLLLSFNGAAALLLINCIGILTSLFDVIWGALKIYLELPLLGLVLLSFKNGFLLLLKFGKLLLPCLIFFGIHARIYARVKVAEINGIISYLDHAK